MKRFFVFLGVVLAAIGSAASAQEVDSMVPMQKSSWGDAKTEEVIDYVPEISLDTRAGYNQYFTDGSGRFGGDGLYLDINGYISPHFSYSLNHRLASTYYEDNSGFNGTNWMTLTYETDDFAVTAGKDALLVGSFEYDAYDLDTYYDMNSMFYNMLDCWQWGVSASWYPADGQSVTFQFANSPFAWEDDYFAYNAAWRGEWDFYESYWTVNMWQFEQDRYVKALNLGNRFYIGGLTLDLEYMTRAADMKSLFKDDFTFLAAPSYEFGDSFRVFAKFGWERVAEGLPYELAYEDYVGSDYLFYGAGVEFFPLKEDKDVRLHAAWSSNNFGDNYLNVGVTWKFDLTGAARYLFGKLGK
jgi:hypothetical protein